MSNFEAINGSGFEWNEELQMYKGAISTVNMKILIDLRRKWVMHSKVFYIRTSKLKKPIEFDIYSHERGKCRIDFQAQAIVSIKMNPIDSTFVTGQVFEYFEKDAIKHKLQNVILIQPTIEAKGILGENKIEILWDTSVLH